MHTGIRNALLLLALAASPTSAQIVVVGVVTNEVFGRAGGGVEVTLSGADEEGEPVFVTTDAEGRFAALLPGPGTYNLATRHPRYLPMTWGPIEATATDEPIELFITLRPRVTPLEGRPEASVLTDFGPDLGADDSEEGTAIRGRVLNAGDGRGIEAATVRLLSEEGRILAATYADASGAFTLPPPAPGPVVVAVEALGYTGRSERVTYRDEGRMTLEIRVGRSPVELEGLEVTVEQRYDYLERSGFYAREKRGLGFHITPEHLEYRRSNLANAMRGIPGVQVTRDGRGIRFVGGASSIGRYACTPAVFVDGMRYHSAPGAETELLDVVTLQDVHAMEVYTRAGQYPAEYGGLTGAGCGIVLVWTRR